VGGGDVLTRRATGYELDMRYVELLGTAFVCGVGDRSALVTARHLSGADSEELITVQHPWTTTASRSN
jgi:hypothetical protein